MAVPTVGEIIAKDIFELLKIEKISDEQKQQLFQTMINTVQARVAARIAALLNEAEAKKFKDLAEAGKTDELKDFLEKQNLDLQKIVGEEAIRYKVEISQLIGLAESK